MLLLSLNLSNYFYVLSSILCCDFSEHMLTDICNSLWQCNFCGLINTTFLLDMSSWWWLILINILHTPVETITNVVKLCLLHKTFICVTYKNVKKKHHDLFSVLHFFGWIHIAHGKMFYSYWKLICQKEMPLISFLCSLTVQKHLCENWFAVFCTQPV